MYVLRKIEENIRCTFQIFRLELLYLLLHIVCSNCNALCQKNDNVQNLYYLINASDNVINYH